MQVEFILMLIELFVNVVYYHMYVTINILNKYGMNYYTLQLHSGLAEESGSK